jgi:hypothetical protein
MRRQLFKHATCAAWGALAVSASADANAVFMTTQSGSNAIITSVSAPYVASCGGYQFNYTQKIKLCSNTCNSGACAPGELNTYTEYLYNSPSRATVTQQGYCSSGSYGASASFYGLASCSC